MLSGQMTTINNILHIIILMIIFQCTRETCGLKCYQCWTNLNAGCFSHNLNNKYLQSCKNDTLVPPICRTISQVQYFTIPPEVNIIRECAYNYLHPLTCTQSKFSDLHYSKVCDCEEDGCNEASLIKKCTGLLVAAILLIT